MKKRIQQKVTLTGDTRSARSARTGDHCPANGWWAALNDDRNGHFITEGSIMPSVNGLPSSWELVLVPPQCAQLPRHHFPPHGLALDSI